VGGLKTINVRSMGSQHVGVFYDGIQLGNAQNGIVDLGRFSLDNMEAVSVYNGQKSDILQPAKDYASASALYLRTRTPEFKDGKRDNVNAAMKFGSFTTLNPSVLWEHKLSDKVSTQVSAEYLYTSGKYKFTYAKADGYDTTAVRQNGDVHMLRAEAGVFGKDEVREWRGKIYFYNSERGYPGAFVREEPGKFKNEDRQWDINFFAQASYQQKVTPRYSFLANAKYAYDFLHYLSDPRLDVTTMYVNNHYRQQELYGSLANLFAITSWWTASLSADLQYNHLNADLVDFVYPSRYTVLVSAATSLQVQRLKLQASYLYTHVDDRTKGETANAGKKNKFTPSIVASWQPFEQHKLHLRAFFKRIFRMPTLNDLYYTFVGNVHLEPEYTTQYDLGATYTLDLEQGWLRQVECQVDGYYNVVDDKIVAMPTANQFRWTMMNFGHVKIKGVDIALQTQWKLGQVGVTARANYTYQKAQDFTNKDSQWYGGQIPYIPWHSGSAIVSAQYGKWELNYSFIYTGQRYTSVANIPENHAQAWYTSDLGLTRSLRWHATDIRLTAEVNNLFNQQYEVVQSYPMPGTNFKLKLNVQI